MTAASTFAFVSFVSFVFAQTNDEAATHLYDGELAA
jgi:hypothetical protein